jgi:hypothetical protein
VPIEIDDGHHHHQHHVEHAFETAFSWAYNKLSGDYQLEAGNRSRKFHLRSKGRSLKCLRVEKRKYK